MGATGGSQYPPSEMGKMMKTEGVEASGAEGAMGKDNKQAETKLGINSNIYKMCSNRYQTAQKSMNR